MNPIETFEAHFVAACEAKVPPQVRKRRLKKIADAIKHYVQRIRSNSREYTSSEFKQVDKSLKYLDSLAERALTLAEKPRA